MGESWTASSRGRGDILENLALSSVGAGRAEHGRLTQLAQSLRGQEVGEGLALRGFDASEARRRFAERLQGTGFNAAESSRGFREALASEGQFFGQGLAADQFGSNQAHRRDQQAIQQQQFGDTLGAGERRFGAGYDANQQQAGFRNRLASSGFESGQNQQQFGQDLAGRGQWFGEQAHNQQVPFQNLAQILAMTGVGQPGFQQTPTYGPMGIDYSGNYGFESSRPNPWLQLAGGLGQAGAAWASGGAGG